MDDPTNPASTLGITPGTPWLPAPQLPKFDRGAALAEFFNATIDWTQAQISGFFGGLTNAEIQLAHMRLHRAGAVLAWENARDAAAAAFPGPVYDEATVTELLGGIRG